MLSFAVIATSLTATYPVVILLFKRHITTHAKTYIEKIICDWAADQVKDVVDDVQDALGIDDDDDKKKAEVTVKTVEMADPSLYTYPSPLAVYAGKEEELEPLSEEKNEDGKSLVNPVSHTQSDSYGKFSYPLDNGIRGGFDVHIYYYQHNLSLAKYASELHQRIRREFPELRIYKFWDRPVGPHTVAMFEVNLFTPAQFGAFVPWLVVNRGPLSVLLHPNTERGVQGESEERDHTQRAVWMGERLPLDLSVFREEEKKVQVKEVKIELDVGGLEERIRAAESSGGDVEVEGGRGKGKEVDEPVAGPSN